MQRNASMDARGPMGAHAWESSGVLAHAMGGGPGVDTHTSFSEGRRRARVHRFRTSAGAVSGRPESKGG